MSKRFKTGSCAYCDARSETADHVFARGFFPLEARDDLPQVGACGRCNNEKSQLEHYLLSVLPFGGNHPGSPALLSEFVPRRLARNRRLHRELAQGQAEVPIGPVGEAEPLVWAIPFDSDPYFAYFRFVARGLAAFHWDCRIPPDYVVSTGMAVGEHERILRALFVLNSSAYARGNLGNGLVLYEGQQAVDDPCLTIWRFQLYGPMTFSSPEEIPGAIRSDIWAVTAKEPMSGLHAE